jgi:hypothetical protein
MTSTPARPTFDVEEVVRIYLRGVPNPRGFPYLPDDQGLVVRIRRAVADGELPDAAHWGPTGGGVVVGYWSPADAPAVVKFLAEHADQVEDVRATQAKKA